jgi:hypothetical protein
MGLLWRLFAPKPLKKARRTVRKAAHPVHTATRAVTPKPVKQLQRAAHPASLAKLKAEDAAVNVLRGKPKQKQSRRRAQAPKKAPATSSATSVGRVRPNNPTETKDPPGCVMPSSLRSRKAAKISKLLASRTSRTICGTSSARAVVMSGCALISMPCWFPRTTIPTTRML